MNPFWLLIISAFTLLSCSHGQKTEASEEGTSAVQIPAGLQLAATPDTDLYNDGKAKVIKVANYRFEVTNIKKSTEAIEEAVKKYSGYISSSDLTLQGLFFESKVSIRVQSEYFHDLLREIDRHALSVNFRNVKTEDVSKEFVDLESRLKTKREVEQRYMEILRKKAGTIEELLKAEQQIGDLHEEIESTIGRVNYLKNQVSYSTINLEYYQVIDQEVTASNDVSRKDEFEKALSAGWEGLLDILLALTYVWPVLICAVIAFISFKYLKRKRTESALSRTA